MTDASMPENAVKTSIHTLDARTKKRNAAEARFKAYGIAAIAAGLMMLVVLVTTIVGNGFGIERTALRKMPTWEVDLVVEILVLQVPNQKVLTFLVLIFQTRLF